MSLSVFHGVWATTVPSLLPAASAEEVETGKPPVIQCPWQRVGSRFQVFHERKNTAFLLDEGGYNGVFPFRDTTS